MYDLSILIPARNEMFLSRTVEDILKNKRGKTEIIIGLDGEWADPVIPDHPDVTIFYVSESIGQRAMTNQCARLSKAKYVMKLDAHCVLDEGFDVKLLEEMQDDYTMIPLMRNLHVFDWVCIGKTPLTGCGWRIYQAPTPDKCPECGGSVARDILWRAKESPRSTSFRFDNTLHFQYFGEYKKIQEKQGGNVVESMSIQGSCFLMTREKYWELNICDENFGSWGQQGVEVACKTWLSGGKVVCNKKTWYAHMFRTQGGDFSFPYHNPQSKIDRAREISRDLFFNNKWEGQKYPLSWLLEKFWPVPGWTDEDLKNMKAKGEEFYQRKAVKPETVNHALQPTRNIIFFTDNQLNLKIAHKVQRQLKSIGIPIVSASLKPMPNFGRNIHIKMERGHLAYFTQILSALEASDADIIYMCEHDVLYHPSHFEFTPPTNDKFYYNQNWWRVRTDDNFCVRWDANQVSGLVCYRKLLVDFYRKRLEEVKQGGYTNKMGYEPGGRNTEQTVAWKSKYPNVDFRHGKNLSKNKWSLNDFRDKSTAQNFQTGTLSDIPGWDFSKGLL